MPGVRILAGTREPPSAARLQEAADACPGISIVPLDVTDERTLTRAAGDARSAFGEVDLLLNCAGVLHDASRGMQPERRLEDVSADSLAHAFAVNATGALLLARHFAPLLPVPAAELAVAAVTASPVFPAPAFRLARAPPALTPLS